MSPDDFFRSVIGHPWASGAEGPEAFDCWGLVRAFYREVRGVTLAVVDVDATRAISVAHAFTGHEALGAWEKIEHPADGSAVLMARGRTPNHVGLWLGGGILHSMQGAGVIYTTPLMLRHAGLTVLGHYGLK